MTAKPRKGHFCQTFLNCYNVHCKLLFLSFLIFKNLFSLSPRIDVTIPELMPFNVSSVKLGRVTTSAKWQSDMTQIRLGIMIMRMNVGCSFLRPSTICFLQITSLDSAINQNVN